MPHFLYLFSNAARRLDTELKEENHLALIELEVEFLSNKLTKSGLIWKIKKKIMSSLIPLLKTPPPPETAPRAQKKTKLAKVMAKTRLGDGEFDLGVLLAKVPGKSLVQEGN